MHATAVGCRREYARSTWRTAWDGCQVTFSPRDRRRHPQEGLQPFLRGNHSARTLLNQRVPVRSASQPSGAISRLPNPLLSLSFSYRLGTPAPRHPRRVEALGSHSVILHQRRGSRVSNREPPTLVTTILFKSIPSFRTVHIRTISAAYTASSRHAYQTDNGHPRTRQGLLQALPQRQRRHSLQNRLHRLPRAMAQQCLQARRAHATAQI
jgi:hypothetical protein